MMSQVVSVSTQAPPTGPTGGNSLWNVIKTGGQKAGKRASIAAQQTKIRAEMMRIDQKITRRRQKFGVELYDSLILHAEQDETFIIESDTLENVRGNFVTAFKDNKALLQKKARQQQELVEVDEKRAVVHPKVPCETFGGQMKHAGMAANFVRQEAACRNRIAVLEADVKSNKKKFGEETYLLLVHLEDNQKWLSPDRDVRFLYDAARRDIAKMMTEKQQKEAEWGALAEM